MSNVFIAFLVALGSGAWIYNKFMRSTGGNTKNSLTSAGVAAVAIFVLMFIILMFVGSWLGS